MDLSARIIFHDAEAFVLDKPAGLPVDAPRSGGDSIERRIHELKFGFKRPPTPMHRLDQDTSGCLLFARHPSARAQYQAAFESGAVTSIAGFLARGTTSRTAWSSISPPGTP